jgi:raffinose/stachyose/melibiose transport system substrate-binding protein
MIPRSNFTRRALIASLTVAPLAGCARRDDGKTVRVLHIETNKDVLRIWRAAADRFSAQTGAHVDFRVMEPRAFQSRRATLMQSDGRPHLFYSWGGASVDALRAAGLLEDITARVKPETLAQLMPRAVATYRREGALYGLPYLATQIGLIGNRTVLDKAGVAVADLATWDGFLAALPRIASAGFAPIAAGGMDAWPLTLMLTQLALNEGGDAAMEAALRDRDGGFASAPMLAAARKFETLARGAPFQPGYLSAKAQAAMQFLVKDGAGLMMHGTWFYRQAAALTGQPPATVAERFPFIGFPTPHGGPSAALQGQLNGWLVTRDAPDIAVDFLQALVGQETQAALARAGHIIPANLAARPALTHPELIAAAGRLDSAPSVQLAWDGLLGSNGGSTANEATVRLASGQMDAERAMTAIRRGWRIELKADQLDGRYAGALADLVGKGQA